MSPTTITNSAFVTSAVVSRKFASVAFAQRLRSELEANDADGDHVSGLEHDRYAALDTDTVQSGAVRAHIDDVRDALLTIDSDFEMVPRRAWISDEKPMRLVDAGALAPDEQAVGDRNLSLIGRSGIGDECCGRLSKRARTLAKRR